MGLFGFYAQNTPILVFLLSYRKFIVYLFWIASKMTDHNSIIWSCLASRDNGLHRRKTYILIYKKGQLIFLKY